MNVRHWTRGEYGSVG